MKVISVILSFFLAYAGLAQESQSIRFRGQQVDLTKPTGDKDCPAATDSAAKLCLRPSGICYTPPKNNPQYGFEPTAKIIDLNTKQDAIFFSATSSACGSGSLTYLALLDIRFGKLDNLLSNVTVSNQGEYKILREPTLSDSAIIVVADALWGDGETHFARHRFLISSYFLGRQTPYYFLRDQYVTSMKYPSLDEVDKITVIEAERPQIMLRLRQQSN
jgi:hypothetical protein